MKRTSKGYRELLQNFKDLAIKEYGLDEPDEDYGEGNELLLEALIREIQTAPTFREVAEILEDAELDGVIKVLEDSLQTWFSPH